MRTFLILFIASPAAIGSPWLDGPRGKGNVQETSQPFQANTKATITKAEAGCEKCGLNCECGPGCECTADYWKDWCKAVPASQRAAYYRSIAARSVPASVPFTQGTIVHGAGNRSMSLTGQMWAGPIGIGVGITGNRGGTDRLDVVARNYRAMGWGSNDCGVPGG